MTETLQLDHLVYAVPDLALACTDFERALGVRPEPGGSHPDLATHNAILPLQGGAYVELIAADPAQAKPALPRPFGLDALDGPRLVTWALRTEDIEQSVRAARARGFDPGRILSLSRTPPAAQGRVAATLHWKLSIRSDGPDAGLVPFLIDWGRSTHPASGAREAVRLRSLRAESPDPAAVERALAALGARLRVDRGERSRLVAEFAGPAGTLDLR